MELATQFWLSLAVGFILTTFVAGFLSEIFHKLHLWYKLHDISPRNRWRHL